MKKIREYHIEHYWAEEAKKQQKKAEIKERVGYIALLVCFFALWFFATYEFCDLLFESL